MSREVVGPGSLKTTLMTRCTDCGVEKELSLRSLRNPCPCHKKKAKKQNPPKQPKQPKKLMSLPMRLYNAFKASCVCRGLECRLSFEDWHELVTLPCHYCGEVGTNQRTVPNRKETFSCNGIDRKDPSAGYLLNNCVGCCWKCNEEKKAQGYEEFLEGIKKKYLNLKKNLVF